MKLIIPILLFFLSFSLNLAAHPTKEELLEKLYLVSVGTKQRYGKFLEDGILTDKYDSLIGDLYPFSICPNFHDTCDYKRLNNFRILEQRGLFYFSPGYVFPGFENYDIAYIIPLKHVYNKTINISPLEFITYDNIQLQPGSIVLLDESIPKPQYLEKNNIQTHYFHSIKDDLQKDAALKKNLVKESIQAAGGFTIEPIFNTEITREHIAVYTINGKSLSPKDLKAFYGAILNEYISYGYKNISRDQRFAWVEYTHDMYNAFYGDHRNFGFEFYSFMQNIYKFLNDRGIKIEDTGSFQEYVKAFLLSWDLLSFEKTGGWLNNFEEPEPVELGVLLTQGQARLLTLPSRTRTLDMSIQEKLDHYENKPLAALFEDLIEAGAYQYKSIPSTRFGFKRAFIDQTFKMSRQEAIHFIAGYKAFLVKTQSEPPYPLFNLETELLALYDQIHAAVNPAFNQIGEDASLKTTSYNKEMDAGDITHRLVIAANINNKSLNELVHDMANFHTSNTSATLFERTANYCWGLVNAFYHPVYLNKASFIIGDLEITFELDFKTRASFDQTLPNDKTPSPYRGVFIGNSTPASELVIKHGPKELALFSLQITGPQSAFIELNGYSFVITANVTKSPDAKAYLVNTFVEMQNTEDVIRCDRKEAFSKLLK